MKKFNSLFLKYFYESFMFLLPKKYFNSATSLYKYKNFILLDNYILVSSIRQILLILQKCIFLKRKNKIVFYIEPGLLKLLKPTVIKAKSFYTDDFKDIFSLIQNDRFKNKISLLVIISQEMPIAKQLLNNMNFPILVFSPSYQTKFNYNTQLSLFFNSSAILLRVLLNRALSNIKKKKKYNHGKQKI